MKYLVLGLALLASPSIAQDNGKSVSGLLMKQMENSQYKPIGRRDGRIPSTAMYKGEYKEGMSKFCVYSNTGSRFVLTVGITEICPR